MEPIREFQGEFRFLSNFWPADVRFGHRSFPTVEHAYQAWKATNKEDFKFVASSPTPGEAKRRGRKITVREDWDRVKLPLMEMLVRSKFDRERNPQLLTLLLLTGERKLIEGNKWGDTFWGVCNGEGENHLGKLLMKIRAEHRDNLFLPFGWGG
jgi:ribA/ribD-fused uncharacterized protein